jgi:hypothetical protein
LFAKLFRRKLPARNPIVVAHLNVRSQPLQRGEFFEDPLDELLAEEGLGSVVGGGTELADEPAGVSSSEIEISVTDTDPDTILKIIVMLEKLGAPKGSEIRIEGRAPAPFGATEGLALFLNGTDLPGEVYESADVNATLSGLSNAMTGKGMLLGHWEGSRETALYFYGPSFDAMKEAALAYTIRDPLCRQCRIEQIA